ncbi:MAG: 60S ribosomal protein L37a [Candidatus Micrarchaeota archaeon]|nr:60S ribosomal protein L37a [Candidatus Micrarchaeota archaeon]
MSKHSVRFGAELRKRAGKIDQLRRSLFICPRCGKKKVRRAGNSLFECRSCGSLFAGGAYSLSTPSGEVASRIIGEMKKR